MSLRWIFLVLIFAWGIHVFAAIEDFAAIVAESIQNEKMLAAEIQSHLGFQKEKTLEYLTESESVALEGFNIKVY
ncbi:MAG: hypothetical protein A2622_06640 [Bdellovibrionales bacterium RIFCSPHIGHO2_01_FULL_40_29]|nr:MAG: hypothetical protein A2622_06640 [Bdellovibrionales bacterium RIFCSPHIGHO2_01_FULL_40_29]OFZ35119.1 MAG: hypothetical protein A3D17_06990 [Bdellovibrionales bacterium RIFCSPHIGHO2_02_FULL_40_15]